MVTVRRMVSELEHWSVQFTIIEGRKLNKLMFLCIKLARIYSTFAPVFYRVYSIGTAVATKGYLCKYKYKKRKRLNCKPRNIRTASRRTNEVFTWAEWMVSSSICQFYQPQNRGRNISDLYEANYYCLLCIQFTRKFEFCSGVLRV